MRECARNGEMHSNKIREIIRKRYNESLITLKPKNININPKIKSKHRVIEIERTNDKRKYIYKDFERIMSAGSFTI